MYKKKKKDGLKKGIIYVGGHYIEYVFMLQYRESMNVFA